MNKHAARLISKHYPDQDSELVANVSLLYYIHFILLSFLLLALIMVLVVTVPGNQLTYRSIAVVSVVGIVTALYLNLNGKFKASLQITLLLMFVMPWLSILYEYLRHSGDYVPMMYMIIPIQLMALFMPLKPMFSIATAQTALLAGLILLDPARDQYNWASLICYLFLTTMLGTIISYVLRKQYLNIMLSRNNLAISENKMREISIRDPLTGLYNRRFMNESFDDLLSRTTQSFSLLMVDIDHFKEINDTFGHTSGDEVIRKVADILVEATRKQDIVCRYGGDEFVVILVDCNLNDALVKAQQIKQQVESLVVDTTRENSIALTASIGVAHSSQSNNSRDAILRAVDTALYTAKQNGRNQAVAAEDTDTV